jgi:enoyl-CoA hydratase/carnithine racemase
MLLRARLLDAEEACAAGFVAQVCDDDGLDGLVAEVVETLLAHAPLTMWAAKAAVARLRRAGLPDGDDIVAEAFGSNDFREAVAAFGAPATRGRVAWTGR